MAKSEKIENFIRLDIGIEYEDALKSIAEDCKDDIISNANSHKDWKDYAIGWEVRRKKIKGENAFVVRNKTHYRLTHLLENGHLIVNKKGGVGWSAPRPHIKPAFDKAKKEIDFEIKKRAILKIK